MSEHLIPNEALPAPEHHEALAAPAHHEALPPRSEAEETQRRTLQEARAAAQHESDNDNPLRRHEAAERAAQAPQASYLNQELKSATLRRELQHLRRQLAGPERRLSQVIHQPAIRAVSEAAGQTISRPSGLLGGGLLAFLGCTAYLYLAKHVGFSYNYFVFVLLFAAGFGLGLAAELAVWTFTQRRRHSND